MYSLLDLAKLGALLVQPGLSRRTLLVGFQDMFLKLRDLAAVTGKVVFCILPVLGFALLLFADFRKFLTDLFSAMPELLGTLGESQRFNLNTVMLRLHRFRLAAQ